MSIEIYGYRYSSQRGTTEWFHYDYGRTRYHNTLFLILIFNFYEATRSATGHNLTAKMNNTFPSLYEQQLLAQQRALIAGGYHNGVFNPQMQMIQQQQHSIERYTSKNNYQRWHSRFDI